MSRSCPAGRRRAALEGTKVALRIPLSPHGIREMAWITIGCALLAAGLAAIAWPLVLLPVAIWIFGLAFFRDPDRSPPAEPPGEAVLVAPADGTVADVAEVPGTALLDEPCLQVGIFLSVLDVHVNRAPISGRVAALRYTPGRFLDARDPRCSRENEAQDVRLDGAFPVVIRQVAGLIARRIVCPLVDGQSLERGQRMGMIKFGSRTELIVPLRLAPRALVRVGDKVRGAATPLVSIPR
jgi:phosphatidylserine decarboxylase